MLRHCPWLAVLLCFLSPSPAHPQPLPEDRGAAGLRQSLKQLQNRLRVLYITAHPDDEDAGLLTWLARGQGAEVTQLSLTRGEAGANLITADSFDRLGMLRTLEHRKAARAYGIDVRYTSFADFGYSKNVAETWRKWDRDQILADVVREVRRLRPHVVFARFQGTPRDGHGHHEASGLLAKLAFEAAADARRFPDLGPVWQPKKLYTSNWQPAEATLAIDTGAYDPVIGRSFAEIGREGYRWHRSQAMGAVLVRPGPFFSYLKLAASTVGEAASEQSPWERLGDETQPPAEVAALVQQALREFNPQQPRSSAETIAKAIAALQPGQDGYRARLLRALNRALGIELEALVRPDDLPTGMAALFRPWRTFQVAAPGQSFRLQANLAARAAEVTAVRYEVIGIPASPASSDPGDFRVTVPPNASPSAAPWRRDSLQQVRYQGATTSEPPLLVRAHYRFLNVDASIETVALVSDIDSLGLQIRRPLAVGPALSVRFPTHTGVLPSGQTSYRVAVELRNVAAGPRNGTVSLDAPANTRIEPARHSFSFEREGEQARFDFTVFPRNTTADIELRAVAESAGRRYSGDFHPITFTGLDTIHQLQPARHTIRSVNVKVAAGIKAGYIMGAGDAVPETLRQLGVPVDLLDATQIATADLSRYHVLLLGIRAYAARPELHIHNTRLLEYVRAGGVLIVQYNTQEYDRNYGPYPYTMTARAEEISEEDAPVRILAPAESVFRFPNTITAADFNGWVEQRGSKFWITWDDRYQPLIESNDTGQPPQRGGWLQARHGKGLYVYCAYAWYRQLPEAVPGALRLFANLVSLGSPEAPWR